MKQRSMRCMADCFFLGAFLGIMFLIVTVMLIFYKQISEGYEDKERYVIMEKSGNEQRRGKKSRLLPQIRIVFFSPACCSSDP